MFFFPRTNIKMEIPRRFLFSAILSLLVAFVVVVLLPGQLFEFVTTLSGTNPGFPVPTDRLRTKFSGENPHLAVGAAGVIHRKKSRDRTATVSSKVSLSLSLQMHLPKLKRFLSRFDFLYSFFLSTDLTSVLIVTTSKTPIETADSTSSFIGVNFVEFFRVCF